MGPRHPESTKECYARSLASTTRHLRYMPIKTICFTTFFNQKMTYSYFHFHNIGIYVIMFTNLFNSAIYLFFVKGHPNIKLFISNGGLLSTQEAIYHGVPLLGIPLTAEHDLNMELAENSGYALTWEIMDLNKTDLHNLIDSMLEGRQ